MESRYHEARSKIFQKMAHFYCTSLESNYRHNLLNRFSTESHFINETSEQFNKPFWLVRFDFQYEKILTKMLLIYPPTQCIYCLYDAITMYKEFKDSEIRTNGIFKIFISLIDE